MKRGGSHGVCISTILDFAGRKRDEQPGGGGDFRRDTLQRGGGAGGGGTKIREKDCGHVKKEWRTYALMQAGGKGRKKTDKNRENKNTSPDDVMGLT